MNIQRKPDVSIDLSGLKCPLPVLKTKKALTTMQEGELLQVITTDPSSMQDIPAYAKMSGITLISSFEVDEKYQFILEK